MATPNLDELADQLNRLSQEERQILFRKLRHREFLLRLEELSAMYRARLEREGELVHTREELLAAWAQQREDLARRDYPE